MVNYESFLFRSFLLKLQQTGLHVNSATVSGKSSMLADYSVTGNANESGICADGRPNGTG
ncbi:hypothetical protein D3C71_1976650 [compost metagenome]